MYTAFYNLSGRPFQLTPDPSFYFNSRTHKKAMAYLTYGLNQGEGFIIITGEIGSGKTTLVGHLFDELDRSKYVAAKVVTTHLDADNILRMVAGAFGLPHEGFSKASLLERIEQFLQAAHLNGKRCLLVVDESQNLPTAALEELRMLSNFQIGDKALLQSFLLGQPEFRDKLAVAPDLEQLRQRVIATHHLDPMDSEETAEYIRHRLSHVGWKDDPHFTEPAFKAIFDYTEGVPRRLNTLCSRLLLLGAIEELHTLDKNAVDEVVKDLERDKSASKLRTPMIGAQPLGEPAARSMIPAGAADPALYQRIAVLEQYVKAHDRAIQRAFELAATYLDGGEDTA